MSKFLMKYKTFFVTTLKLHSKQFEPQFEPVFCYVLEA